MPSSPAGHQKWLHVAFALIGLAGFAWCSTEHVCCGGHLQHPPYRWWHYAIDIGWGGAFVASSLLGRNLSKSCRSSAVIMTILTLSRMTGSMGGILLVFFEVPLALALVLLLLNTTVIPMRPRAADSIDP